MDCYTKQRCPGCQQMPQGPQCRQGVPMGPGPVIRPDLPLGSGPAVRPDRERRPEMPMGPGPVMPQNMMMGPGPAMPPEMPPEMPMGPDTMSDRGYAARPDMPVNPGTMNPSGNIDQYPVAMAYVPWQRWQQVYPVDKAISRGTIFPDLDKPFLMGRCR